MVNQLLYERWETDMNLFPNTTGLLLLDGKITQLSKYDRKWHIMFDEHKINIIYKTPKNFETFCHLNYMGMDAEMMFVQEIKNIK